MKTIMVKKDSIEGFTAAWICRRMLKQDCEIVFFGNGDVLPNTKGKDLYVFGLSFSRQNAIRLSKEAIANHTEFRLFDNDFFGRQILAGIREAKINMKQTAARMAWEFLRADFSVKVGKEGFRFMTAPWIVDYSDSDKLWKWPNLSRFFLDNAIKNCYEMTMESWDQLATRDPGIVIDQGKNFLKQKQEKQEEAVHVPEQTGESNAEAGKSIVANRISKGRDRRRKP